MHTQKSISHEGKYEIFDMVIKIFFSSEDTIEIVKNRGV